MGIVSHYIIPSILSGFLLTRSPYQKSQPVNCQLVRVLHDILEDETFKFNSKPTREACEAAVLLLDWAIQEENLSVTTEF